MAISESQRGGFSSWALLLGTLAGLVWAFSTTSVFGFALLTAISTALVSANLLGDKLRFDRILFFRKPVGLVGKLFLGIFFLAILVSRTAAVGFAALFTIPDPAALSATGNEQLVVLAASMSADVMWTGIVAGTIIFIALFCILFAERALGMKAARWGFFRLPLVIGIAYSAAVTLLADVSSNTDVADLGIFERPVFPEPSFNQAMPIVRSLFGTAISDETERVARGRIETILDEIKTATNIPLGSTPEEIARAAGVSSTRGLCLWASKRVDGVSACEGGRFDWLTPDNELGDAPECWRPFSDADGNQILQRMSSTIEATDDAKSAVWHAFRCGTIDPNNRWCASRNRVEPGCIDTKALANASQTEISRRLEQVRALVFEAEADYIASDALVASAPALFTVLDSFVHDRITDAIDRFAFYLLDLREPRLPTQSLASDPRWLVSDTCDMAETNVWCNGWLSPVRFSIRAVLSPNVAQGFVLATYLSMLLLVFGARGHGRLDKSIITSELWNYSDEPPEEFLSEALLTRK
nr:hypothetical protein [Nitrosomonas nitrosa]